MECRVIKIRLLLGLLACGAIAGCQQAPDKVSARPTAGGVSQTDPCAERLHDLCEPLLLYYLAHRELPSKLEDLNETAGGKPLPPLECQISHKPFVYHPEGWPLPGTDRHVIVYEADGAHAGMRWAIVTEPPRPGQPLILQVRQLTKDPSTLQPPIQP